MKHIDLIDRNARYLHNIDLMFLTTKERICSLFENGEDDFQNKHRELYSDIQIKLDDARSAFIALASSLLHENTLIMTKNCGEEEK